MLAHALRAPLAGLGSTLDLMHDAPIDERHCHARSKRSGKQCENFPMTGQRVCRMHGGKTPAAMEAGARRIARETALQVASRELAKRGLPDMDPLEHLEAVLAEDARAFAIWDAACELLVGEGSTLLGRDSKGAEAIHPYVQERNAAAQRWARTSKYALDAGVSLQRVEIERDKANLLAGAMKATLAALGLSPDVQTRGLELLGEQLRRLGPGSV